MSLVADQSRARQVEMVLDQIESLPTLSPIATRLLSITSRDDAEVSDIVRLVESDPALATRILGLCRKASRGLGDKVTTVRRAVVMLGLEAVRSSVLSVSVYDVMRRGSSDLDARVASRDPVGAELRRVLFDRAGFWKHAVGVACAAELIAANEKKLKVDPDEAFVAGLLHDLGKQALELVLPQSYARVVALAERRQCDSAPVERQVLGLDHHSAGRRLAEHWGLPAAISEVIWLHSQTFATLPSVEHKTLVGVVSVAKALCRQLHIGWSGDWGLPPDAARAAGSMGLSAGVLDKISSPLHESIADRLKVLGLDDKAAPELLLESLTKANRQLARMAENLQERARHAGEIATSLEEVGAFHDERRSATSVVEIAGCVVRSASRVMGEGFYAALLKEGTEPGWHLLTLPRAGETEPARSGDLPDPGAATGAGRALERLFETAGEVSGLPLALVSWVEELLLDLVDIRRIRMLALGREGGCRLIVLHDREAPARRPHAALVSTWESAIAAGWQHEQGQRLGQKLVESHRELEEAQTRLTEAESMARLGEMAAGAAHEMNNPLTVISGRSQLLAARLSDTKDQAAARAIAAAALQLTDLISALNTLADPPKPRPQASEIDAVLRRAKALAGERLGKEARCEFVLGGTLPRLVIDPELTAAALAEVLVNAHEAAPKQAATVRAAHDADENLFVVVVEDDGPGFSERALQHGFDPFFSEKTAGRQRGLGLTKARRLVESQGGRMALGVRPGGGAIVRLMLPARSE
jgi:putative nucleotidyltransferase with HDIG domain